MVHKKYIKKNGKTYGPYYYESYRENGKVKKRYVKNPKEKKKFTLHNIRPNYPLTILALVVIVLAFMTLLPLGITGKVSLELETEHSQGEVIKGVLKLTLKEGELLPDNSVVKVEYGEISKEMKIFEIVEYESVEGKYYSTGNEIAGEGQGYGIKGMKKSHPEISFELRITDKTKNGKEENKIDEEIGEELVDELESDEGLPAEAIEEESEVEEGKEETSEKEEIMPEETQEIQEEETAEETETSPITGQAILENEEIISGKTSYHEEFTTEIGKGKTAETIPGSVRVNGEEINEEEISIKIQGTKLTVTTQYYEEEEGYGKEYLGEEEITLEISIGQFGMIAAEEEEIKIQVLYEEEVLARTSQKIRVKKEKEPEKEIPTLKEQTNQTNQTVNTTVQNSTNGTNVSVSTTQHGAILNQPVRWNKKVTLEKPGSLKVKLPKNAEEIVILEAVKNEEAQVGDEEVIVGVDGSVITGNIIIESEIQEGSESEVREGTIPEILEEEDSKILNVKEKVEEVTIEYTTPAPRAEEKTIKNGKEVKIVGPETVHYENVLAFTQLPESLQVTNPEKVRIKWQEENIMVTPQSVQDKDANGIYDFVEWVVPHLSNQTFDIIVITKADHLDQNRSFVSDIYEEVKAQDDVWSETIPENHYVRVTFEQELDSTKDITIWPRIISGHPQIEVYEQDQNEIIAKFENITENEYNTVLLDGSSGVGMGNRTQDVFDLKILGGSLEFDHIIDPQAYNASNTIYQCGYINNSGMYTMNQSMNTTGTCLTINASHVNLDCQNYNIEGDGVGTTDYGIYLDGGIPDLTNITISNCNVTDMGSAYYYRYVNNSYGYNLTSNGAYRGLYLNQADNNKFDNLTFENDASGGSGVYLSSSDYNIITNMTVKSYTGAEGLEIYIGSEYNNITQGLLENNNHGIRIRADNNIITEVNISNSVTSGVYLESGSEDNLIYNNYFNNPSVSEVWDVASGVFNDWNTTLQAGTNIIGGSWIGGNYWANYKGWDSDGDGIGEVGAPKVTGLDLDYLPLVDGNNNDTDMGTNFTRCIGIASPGTYTLGSNVTADSVDAYCYNIESDDVTLDCQNNYIIGDDGSEVYWGGIAIEAGSSTGQEYTNITIKNCHVKDAYRGITAYYMNDSVIEDSSFNSNKNDGMDLLYDFDSNIIRNVITNNNGDEGITIIGSGNNLTNITSNYNAGCCGVGIRISFDSANGNTLTNIITNYNTEDGIEVSDAMTNAYAVLTNITARYNAEDGISIESTSRNNLTGGIISDNGNDGIGFVHSGGGDDWIIKDLIIENNTGEGVDLSKYLATFENNLFYNNKFNNTINVKVVAGTDNFWNTTETAGINIVGGGNIAGNYWAYPNGTGHSETCADSDYDDICDTNHTINISTSSVDFLPLTNPTPPNVTIVYPTNTTYTSAVIELNYTVSDGNLDTCWYTNNTGTTNNTITCGTNVTALNTSEGTNTLTMYANDTTGTQDSSTITFSQDTIIPLISYGNGVEDSGTNYSRSWIYINVSVTETNEQAIIFRLYNTTGEVNTTTYTDSTRTINFTNLADGTYTYNATVNDTAGNTNTTETRTITLDTQNPLISYGSGTPANWANLSQTSIFLNASVTETNLKNVSFYVYNSSGIINYTAKTTSPYEHNVTGLSEGNYSFNISAWDNSEQYNSTSERTVTLDLTDPTITFSCTPTTVEEGGIITCSCTATDNIDSSPNITFTESPSTTIPGTITTTCTATDSAGNEAEEIVNYIVEEVLGRRSGSSGGGGGGAGLSPEEITDYETEYSWEETIEEYSEVELSEIEVIEEEVSNSGRIKLKIEEEQHSVGILEINQEGQTAKIVVFSTPQITTMKVGETKKFEVTNDEYYDLEVGVEKVEEESASMRIQALHEKVPKEEPEEQTQKITPTKKETKTPKIIIISILAIMILIITTIILRKQLTKNKIKRIKENNAKNKSTKQHKLKKRKKR